MDSFFFGGLEMPIYEYRCLSCGKEREVFQKITDEPMSKCPDCGGPLSKLISNTSFVLKGTGWYATDYASGDRKKAMDADKGASKKEPPEPPKEEKEKEKKKPEASAA
jgi:putative FmdB family regulatory protein